MTQPRTPYDHSGIAQPAPMSKAQITEFEDRLAGLSDDDLRAVWRAAEGEESEIVCGEMELRNLDG